jgi:hypothetical protein
VLRAKDYPGVPGPWVVFAGQYTLASDARAAAQRYVKQGFPGAHAQLVKPRGSH